MRCAARVVDLETHLVYRKLRSATYIRTPTSRVVNRSEAAISIFSLIGVTLYIPVRFSYFDIFDVFIGPDISHVSAPIHNQQWLRS